MTGNDVRTKTKTYIMENFLYTRPGFELEDETDLLGNGIIDSMGVMELVEFIQDTFSVTVEDEEITEENLGSVTAIDRYVAGKRQTATR